MSRRGRGSRRHEHPRCVRGRIGLGCQRHPRLDPPCGGGAIPSGRAPREGEARQETAVTTPQGPATRRGARARRAPEVRAAGGGAGPSERRIGVYVCHCGGNISDYVDVDKVVADVQEDPDVVVAKTAMFTCSDASQQEIIEDIKEQGLDGIVVASCSPKLHTFTFREVARRGGLEPLPVHSGERAGAVLMDPHRRLRRRHPQGLPAGQGRHRPHALHGPARTASWSRRCRRLWSSAAASPVCGGSRAGEIGLAVILVEKETHAGWLGRRVR